MTFREANADLLHSLDSSQHSALLAILIPMLNDRSPLAVGSVAIAFNVLCPDRLDLIHPHFRRLAKLLADADEWGQVILLDLLVRYARTMLAKPKEDDIDQDVQLLLSSTEPLFASRNPAVVLAATRVYYYIAPPTSTHLSKPIQPLLRLLHLPPELQGTALASLGLIAQTQPGLLAAHSHRFYVRAGSDSPFIAREKLRILIALAIESPEQAPALLRELEEYTRSADDAVVQAAANAVGRIAASIPECTLQCVTMLMQFIKDPYREFLVCVRMVISD
jgi:AP-3 complex subunit beta